VTERRVSKYSFLINLPRFADERRADTDFREAENSKASECDRRSDKEGFAGTGMGHACPSQLIS
jgi:hypothetical protein